MIEKARCPKCGEKTLEKIWMGIYPQRCPKCGNQPEPMKLKY